MLFRVVKIQFTDFRHHRGLMNPGFLGQLAQGVAVWSFAGFQGALDQLHARQRMAKGEDLANLALLAEDDRANFLDIGIHGCSPFDAEPGTGEFPAH